MPPINLTPPPKPNKEDILAKARQENKGKDLPKQQAEIYSGSVVILVALALVTLFFVVQLVTGGGFNFGLYAVMFSMGAAQYAYKAKHIKTNWRYPALAVIYTLLAIGFSAAHLVGLFTAG